MRGVRTARVQVAMGAAAALTTLVAATSATATSGRTERRGQSGPTMAPCTAPYQPWFHGNPAAAAIALQGLGPSRAITATPPDTDGDGAADTFSTPSPKELAIQRADGTVTLSVATLAGRPKIVLLPGGPQPGDLDGDGRDELFVEVNETLETWAVPGSLAPGSYELRDVGIQIDLADPVPKLVGDQDGDGGADLAFESVEGGDPVTKVASGTALLALGPGGSFVADDPIATYLGTDLVAARVPDRDRPLLVVGWDVGRFVVTVATDPPVELTRSGAPVNTATIGELDVRFGDGELFVTLRSGTGDDETVTAWNLTSPCSRYRAPASNTTTTAPTPTPVGPAPATPLPGSVTYTG